MPEVLFEKNLIKVCAQDNNNKFWNVKAYDNGTVYREWGRVSKTPQKKTESHPDPIRKARSLYESKIKSNYKEVSLINQRKYEQTNNLKKTALEELNKGKSKEVQSLIENLVSTNIHNILKETDLSYDKKSGLFSTPMGIVDRHSVEKARSLLKNISTKVNNSLFDDVWENLCEDYLMIIPHAVGAKVDLKFLFGNLEKIKYEENILKNLENSIEMVEKPNETNDKSDSMAQGLFDVDIDIVTNDKIIDYIKEKFERNIDPTHPSSRLKVKRVFDINIKSMTKSYQEVEDDIGNQRKLWHGTRVGNLLSILHKGMYIPPENSNIVTGRMFGNGLYFSDVSTKALNYSYGTWNKTGMGNKSQYYALLCNVLMGKEFQADQTSFGSRNYYPKNGYDSTFAKASKMGLRHNEMIVYNSKQVAPRYLVEFDKN